MCRHVQGHKIVKPRCVRDESGNELKSKHSFKNTQNQQPRLQKREPIRVKSHADLCTRTKQYDEKKFLPSSSLSTESNACPCTGIPMTPGQAWDADGNVWDGNSSRSVFHGFCNTMGHMGYNTGTDIPTRVYSSAHVYVHV